MAPGNGEIGPNVARGGILSDSDAFIETALALADLAHDEPEEAVHRIAGELRDLTGSRFCAIYMADRTTLRPITVNEHGAVLTELESRICPLKDLPLAKGVIKDSEPRSFSVYGLPLCRIGFDDEAPHSYESAMLLPMVSRRRVIGLVEICDSVARDYDAERIIVERLVKVATRAVIWANDARRLTARELIAGELLALGDFIARARNLDDLVRPLCENLRTMMGAEDCDIWRTDGESITCLGSADSNGWDERVVGGVYRLADYPSYAGAVRSGSVRVVSSRDDASLSAVEREALERWGYHSNLCLPLMVDDKPVGFIDIFDTRERNFAEHLEFVGNVGRMLAGAFYQVVIADRLERGNRDMRVLLDVGRALTSSAMYDDALTVMARKAAEALGMDSCLVHEYVPEMDSLVVRALYDNDVDDSYDGVGVTVKLAEMPGDRAILEGGEVVVEHVSDPGLSEETRASMVEWGEKTCLNVPLWFKRQPVGMMMLLANSEERRFSTDELELAAAIGEQAAVAIENARLYRTLKQKSETDKLTGLYNSRYLRVRLAEEVARARRHEVPISLLVLDLDDFRKFTVAVGRQLANEALSTVTDMIRARLHEHLDVAAHFGGGKFALLLPHTAVRDDDGEAAAALETRALDAGGAGPHRHGAWGVAERLRRQVEGLTTLPSGARLPRGVTMSVGVAAFSPGMPDADALLGATEDAVAQAKKAGKNRVEVAGA
jgi:GGDEF domain-containing protein